MAFTTLVQVQVIPGMANIPAAFLTSLLEPATVAIKRFLKLNVESADFTEYYSGNDLCDLILRQWPVQAINNVWLDFAGYWGQGANAFPNSTKLTAGADYALDLDSSEDDTPLSQRGILKRIGAGAGGAWSGWWPQAMGLYSGKLAGYRPPGWARGQGNIKVDYTAGWPEIPADLVYACNMLVAGMVRNLPSGLPLNNEGLGSYSYSVASRAASGMLPDLSDLGMILRRYREVSL